MRKGFTLIEVMIASFMAALISAALFMTITQMNRVQETLHGVSSIYGRCAILKNQLEHDIMGAFIPTQVDVVQTTTQQNQTKRTPIDKVFYGKNSGEYLELFSCITSNPLQTYFGIKKSKLKPRAARVLYRLEPDIKRQNSFVLTYQEGGNLFFSSYKKDAQGALRAHELIDGIQSLSLSYISIEEKRNAEGKVQRIYKKEKSWNTPKPQTDEKKRRESARLPHMVEVQVVLWDPTYTSTRPFRFKIPIVGMHGRYAMAEDTKKESLTAPEQVQKQSDTQATTSEIVPTEGPS